MADFESDNPYDNFQVVLDGIEAIGVADAVDSMHFPGLLAASTCSSSIPYQSRVARIFRPAGAPHFDPGGGAVRIACPGQKGFVVGTEKFAYVGAVPQGDIELRSFKAVIVKCDAKAETPVPASSVFSSLYLLSGSGQIAADSAFDSDTITLAVEPSLILTYGTTEEISLSADIRPDIEPANYRVKLVDSTAISLRDRNLGSTVFPLLSSGTYPATLGTISVSALDLGSSFSNYPNPFKPADGATTITYALSEDAYVDIELYTITGEPVARLTDNEFRQAGPHQDETWNGLNDRGLKVVSGTYFCRITARYVSGRTESARRKVSVVR
jgi:hypothetical protein